MSERSCIIILKNIFAAIAKESSRLEKQKLILANKDNEEFISALRFLLSPDIVTGISTKKIHKEISGKTPSVLTPDSRFIPDVTAYLSEHSTGTDTDICEIQSFLSGQGEDRAFYESLITKSFRLGVDAKTVNSALGYNLITVFGVMLAEKYFDCPEKVKGEFTLTEKLDGFRLITLIHNSKIEFFSRQGQPVTGLTEVEKDLRDFCDTYCIGGLFLDGELVALNCSEISSEENYKLVSKIARRKGEKTGLKYEIFDILPYYDFTRKKSYREYSYRREMLAIISDFCRKNKCCHIETLPVLYCGSDKEMITYWLDKMREKKKEGIMINLNDKPYEFRRTSSLLKVKVMQDADLRIVDVYEGTGRNKGRLGGVIVEFIHKDKLWRCECGSGFSDEERISFWQNPEKIIGRIATISYFEITRNDSDGYGLRFAIWTHRIRYDKTEISMN